MRQAADSIRSASLYGYVELVKSLGRDPYAFMKTVGLQAKFLDDPQLLLPRDVVREESTPRAALDTLCRYLKLVNASLTIRVEDAGSAVIIREDLAPTPGLP